MPIKIAILGLGEAGSHFANDLVARGFHVSGWDPDLRRKLDERVHFAASNPAAVESADIVFNVNLAAVSESVAEEVCSSLKDDAIFCAMNTSSPQMKKNIGTIAGSQRVIDMAIMGPVPHTGILTPMLAAGKQAGRLQKIMNGSMNIEVLNENIGDAAMSKLLRSIVYKGVAGVICEAMEAGEQLGLEDYMRKEINSIIGENDELIDRFISGSKTHASRRIHEMEAVVEMLQNNDLSSYMSQAAIANLKNYVLSDE